MLQVEPAKQPPVMHQLMRPVKPGVLDQQEQGDAEEKIRPSTVADVAIKLRVLAQAEQEKDRDGQPEYQQRPQTGQQLASDLSCVHGTLLQGRTTRRFGAPPQPDRREDCGDAQVNQRVRPDAGSGMLEKVSHVASTSTLKEQQAYLK